MLIKFFWEGDVLVVCVPKKGNWGGGVRVLMHDRKDGCQRLIPNPNPNPTEGSQAPTPQTDHPVVSNAALPNATRDQHN